MLNNNTNSLKIYTLRLCEDHLIAQFMEVQHFNFFFKHQHHKNKSRTLVRRVKTVKICIFFTQVDNVLKNIAFS